VPARPELAEDRGVDIRQARQEVVERMDIDIHPQPVYCIEDPVFIVWAQIIAIVQRLRAQLHLSNGGVP